jgi:hypothetical protein
MKTLAGIIEAGVPLIQQVIDAMRRYHETKDINEPPEVVELLWLEAESLDPAVTEYQLGSLGSPARTLH